MENSGSFYCKELDMVINHPYGSNEYWNVFYDVFSKRRYEAMVKSGEIKVNNIDKIRVGT